MVNDRSSGTDFEVKVGLVFDGRGGTVGPAPGGVDGFVVEGPTAGGHNAPPRGPLHLSERGEPAYGERDVVDLEQMKALGVPFWLAGAYGSRERFAAAVAAGAHGVQVGTAFAFCEESGLDPELRRRFLANLLLGEGDVFTDPVASPTGFPFKVAALEGTLSEEAAYEERPRLCDLGYLRRAYRLAEGDSTTAAPASRWTTTFARVAARKIRSVAIACATRS